MSRRKNKKRGNMSEEEKKEEMMAEETQASEDAKGAEEAVAEDDGKAALEAKVKDLEAEIADLKDQMLRSAAEMENYKKRLRQEKENAVKYANESIIRDLLDPLDNFSRAIEAAEKTQDVETIKTGVSMVESQLKSILSTNWGLEQFSPDGEDFDPSQMEACMVKEEDGLDKEKVLQVFMKGYKLHGKVLRSAKVVVGKPKRN